MFYDRKSNYSLNCLLVVLPCNLIIIDYGLGNPGSTHHSYTFQSTWITRTTWCTVPFKKMRGGQLACPQNIYNWYVAKICVCVEHAFAALKEL
ncbi:hypothetical protein ID866_12219 [Astraeus odoratus]|nr:hypothetical protein ID866_12219 [Astraeus odoratus]